MYSLLLVLQQSLANVNRNLESDPGLRVAAPERKVSHSLVRGLLCSLQSLGHAAWAVYAADASVSETRVSLWHALGGPWAPILVK